MVLQNSYLLLSGAESRVTLKVGLKGTQCVAANDRDTLRKNDVARMKEHECRAMCGTDALLVLVLSLNLEQ